MSKATDVTVTEAMQRWVNDIVVGLNFCPFAKKEVQQRRIRYRVAEHSEREKVLQWVLDEIFYLDSHPDAETSLMMLPVGYEDFGDYLDLVDYVEAIIDGAGYRGKFQLATFHPQYCFADCSDDDVENYTNRAPYPTLHLLREASMERVLRQYPDPENIPVRNQHKARELGQDWFRAYLGTLK